MPINPAAKQILSSSFPFKIRKHKFKYLGIWIIHNFKHLYKANFPLLIESLKNDFERSNLLPLSLGGRINTIKMNVLPRFLYLFQCIPIFLTKFFFLLLDKLISSFIWNKKKLHEYVRLSYRDTVNTLIKLLMYVLLLFKKCKTLCSVYIFLIYLLFRASS